MTAELADEADAIELVAQREAAQALQRRVAPARSAPRAISRLTSSAPEHPVRIAVTEVAAVDHRGLVADDADEVVQQLQRAPLQHSLANGLCAVRRQLARRPRQADGHRVHAECKSRHLQRIQPLLDKGPECLVGTVIGRAASDQAIHLRGAVGLQIDRQPVDDDQHVQRHAAQALRDQLDFRFQQRVRAVRPVQARDVLHEGTDVGEDELRVDALVCRVAVVQHANEGALALGLDQRDQPAVLFDEAGELCVAEIRPDDIDRFVVRELDAHLPCQLQFPDLEPALLVDQGLQPVFQPLCVGQAAMSSSVYPQPGR